jgi:hypothetical protein
VYNMKFRMWSDFTGHFDVEERSPYAPTRMTETEQRQLRYMDRWNQKYMVCSRPIERGLLSASSLACLAVMPS